MIDIKLIRENPDLVKKNIKKKFQDEKLSLVDEVKTSDSKWRSLKAKADKLRQERNSISKEISEAKKSKDNKKASELLKKAKLIPKKIEYLETQTKALQTEISEIMKKIPNIIHESVPIGKSDKDNVEREKIGVPKKLTFPIKGHAELGESLGVLDFDTSAETSGNGFYYIKGDLALLNQALISYARDFMTSKGYEYVEPPLMIRKKVLDGVYSKAEIDQMSYKVQDEDLYLIATSEHPLIGMFIGRTLNQKELPIKITGYSMCFRKEIGSHGIDEKGIFRTHQFNKQEMIVICKPEDSYKYYDELLNLSKELFKKLKIPIRELESCSADLSDLKAKGADLEAFSPRQKKYFEITSVTNMEAAQARRLGIKFVDKDGQKVFAHTLNNTAIATSRALVAIMENNQTRDGDIKIPAILQKYMGGKKVIESKKPEKPKKKK
ncbi:serine--tRNA ligase [Candidatus Pacearchaeota archaeon]|nr:serine--tRNA ligase [Candidatus Pacearchaeota archaeon]|tara:strand:+ start:7104 stop:8417 length:1314 start_codon:yes stop_codon:yes gene_type:complete